VRKPGTVHFTLTISGRYDQRARLERVIDEKLPSAHPPKVVHSDDRRTTSAVGRLDEPATEALKRVKMNDVRLGTRQIPDKVGGDRWIIVVVTVGPTDPWADRDPTDG
jgi:hypothetical protein